MDIIPDILKIVVSIVGGGLLGNCLSRRQISNQQKLQALRTIRAITPTIFSLIHSHWQLAAGPEATNEYIRHLNEQLELCRTHFLRDKPVLDTLEEFGRLIGSTYENFSKGPPPSEVIHKINKSLDRQIVRLESKRF